MNPARILFPKDSDTQSPKPNKVKRLASALIAAIACLAMVSCTGNTNPPVDPGPAPKVAGDHILTPGDLIEIKVYQEADLTTATRIPESGRIVMPMLGEVPVGGMTVPAATRMIREKLEEKFIQNPQVTLTVVEQARKLFTVLGQVQRPGTFRFPERDSINLIQAIGIAGGYTPVGDPTRITLKRVVNGKPQVLKLNAKQMASDASMPVEVRSGDIISVGERLF